MIDLNLNTESKRSACSDKQLKGKKKKGIQWYQCDFT